MVSRYLAVNGLPPPVSSYAALPLFAKPDGTAVHLFLSSELPDRDELQRLIEVDGLQVLTRDLQY
jgi:hypothetical protein